MGSENQDDDSRAAQPLPRLADVLAAMPDLGRDADFHLRQDLASVADWGTSETWDDWTDRVR